MPQGLIIRGQVDHVSEALTGLMHGMKCKNDPRPVLAYHSERFGNFGCIIHFCP